MTRNGERDAAGPWYKARKADRRDASSAAQIDRLEPTMERLSDAELQRKTLELKDRIRSGKATGTQS